MTEKLRAKFDCAEWSLQFIDEPFRLFKLNNVFADPKYVNKLEKELDNVSFSHQVTDIFSFSQTKDLLSLSLSKGSMLSSFVQFLEFFGKFLSNKFGINLSSKISVSGSKYSLGDFLLCHDDKTEDRCIAFIYYLNSSWDQTWGGSLDLFDHDENGQPSDIHYSFFPEFNSMIFFEVGNLTHHQVSEILTSKNSRKTINGWFHSENVLKLKPLPLFESVPALIESHSRGSPSYLQNLVCNEFLEKKYMELIAESIQENSVIMLQNFLQPKLFDSISKELKSSKISWIQQGPANRKKYDAADLKKLPSKTKRLVTYLQSKCMCTYFETISGLKLFKKLTGDEHSHLMNVEIQSWRKGCYSLMTHNDSNFKSATLDVLLFFNLVNERSGNSTRNVSTVAGNINYCEKEAVAVKYEIEPNNNSICLVHKRKNETWFTSYISENLNLEFHLLRLSYKL